MKIGGARLISCSSSHYLHLILRDADTEKPILGEVFDGMDTMVEKLWKLLHKRLAFFLLWIFLLLNK